MLHVLLDACCVYKLLIFLRPLPYSIEKESRIQDLLEVVGYNKKKLESIIEKLQ